jgi:hypothetical protein
MRSSRHVSSPRLIRYPETTRGLLTEEGSCQTAGCCWDVDMGMDMDLLVLLRVLLELELVGTGSTSNNVRREAIATRKTRCFVIFSGFEGRVIHGDQAIFGTSILPAISKVVYQQMQCHNQNYESFRQGT